MGILVGQHLVCQSVEGIAVELVLALLAIYPFQLVGQVVVKGRTSGSLHRRDVEHQHAGIVLHALGSLHLDSLQNVGRGLLAVVKQEL